VNAVPAVDGFYSCTYYLGFRDDFDVRVPDVLERIVAMEARAGPGRADALAMVREYMALPATHIVPHYHIVSRDVDAGAFRKPVTWVRRWMIEGVYRHIGQCPPLSNALLC
jgi:KUP system potassium uptake protein